MTFIKFTPFLYTIRIKGWNLLRKTVRSDNLIQPQVYLFEAPWRWSTGSTP